MGALVASIGGLRDGGGPGVRLNATVRGRGTSLDSPPASPALARALGGRTPFGLDVYVVLSGDR